MKIIKFPEYYQSVNLGDTPICFLAGCCVYNKWREEIIEQLKPYNIIVVDPYNTNITSTYEQIRWEHYYLNNFINKNFIFSVYFDKYSTQPISMYELGKATALCKPCFVKVETNAQQVAMEAQAASDKANELASGATAGLQQISQVFYADATGAHVKAANDNETVIQSDGMHVMVGGTEVARFTRDDSHVDNLAVGRFLMFGAHRAEVYEQDGEVGTGFFWIGDVQ